MTWEEGVVVPSVSPAVVPEEVGPAGGVLCPGFWSLEEEGEEFASELLADFSGPASISV